MKHFFYILLACVAAIFFAYQSPEKQVYLFSSFRGNGEDGLHLAYSEDGLHWHNLKNDESFLQPEVGKSKLMRDPCIIRGGDGNFHMVWTAGWNENGIGYATSTDLVHWSEQKYIPVMQHEDSVLNTWAPEIFYNEQEDYYMIYWASTIPGRFPETDGTGDNRYNHRIYYVTTKDFKKISDTKLLYDRGFNVIDATIVKSHDEYIMFLKNETRHPAEKNIRISRSGSLTGPYSEPTDKISPDWVEGPTAIKIDDQWVVYFDEYTRHHMGAIASTDLTKWQNITDRINFPEGTRHGSVFKVSQKEFNKLLKLTR